MPPPLQASVEDSTLNRVNGGAGSAPSARWIVREPNEDRAALLCERLGLHPLTARLMAARGFCEPETAGEFLQPALRQIHDPFMLKDIEPAVERIGRALREHETIRVYGDYDVDGIAATALLSLTLRALGGEVDYYIPHRLNEGYGLNREAIEQLAGEGARLIVTVDCGITAVEEAARAAELGIDLIITDHHEPPTTLPRALAVINPRQSGCAYPFKGLAGVGVAFKLAHALLKRHHPDAGAATEFLKSLLDLVALGTVADIVPLVGENRVLVAAGLKLLQRPARLGLAQLIRRASLGGRAITTTSIGFGLGPRLNAAGRTEHALYGVELLLTEDRAEAERLSEQLEKFNDKRRAIESAILEEALELIEPFRDDPVLVVSGDGWHHGVLGIVASRVLSRHYRPTIVIGIEEGVAKGSGRSIDGFDLHAALTHCAGCLTRFGGHKMAAGLSLPEAGLDAFRAAINEYARGTLRAEDLRPTLTLDAEVGAEELTLEAVEQLARLEPYGQDNPKPLVAVRDLHLIDDPRVLKDRHLKLSFVDPAGRRLAALGWGMAGRALELNGHRGPVRLAGAPFINEWNGRKNVELEIRDWRIEG